MFVVTPSTVVNPRSLRLTRLGGQMLGRGLRVIPRRPLRRGVFWRILFDQAPLRYVLALSPFPIAMILRPDLALAISQAPLLMFAIVFMVESTFLSVSTPEKRRRLIGEAEAARGLDLLRLRAREALARIAAGRGMAREELHLVVEQSGLARVPVLTLVSVQVPRDGGRPELVDLTEAERDMLHERLFDAGFDERLLHRINLAENRFVRDVAFEARGVSAHQRLLAKAAQRGAAPA